MSVPNGASRSLTRSPPQPSDHRRTGRHRRPVRILLRRGGSMETDYVIIGGGVVGLSVAWGLLKRGLTVTVLDGDDGSFRASRGNFGLVWVQSKGLNQPRYARWSQHSAAIWAEFRRRTGPKHRHRRGAGTKRRLRFSFLRGKPAGDSRKIRGAQGRLDGDYPFEVLGHNALRKEEPHIGPRSWARSCTIRTARRTRSSC